MAVFTSLLSHKAGAQTQLFYEDFESPDSNWVFQHTGDTATWTVKSLGGIGNSRAMRCSRVTDASGNQAIKYYAALPGLDLTNGHHYTIRFKSRVTLSNARNMKLAWNTTPTRNGSMTLIHDFDTLTNDNYETFSASFTATSTQTHYFILFGDNLLSHPDPVLWYIDEVEVFRNNQEPTVAITFPVNYQTYIEGPMTITATASDPDGSIARVVFYVDEDSVGQALTSPYSFTHYMQPKEEEGTKWYVKARAFDNGGLQVEDNIAFSITANSCSLTDPETSRQIICAGDSIAMATSASTGTKKVQWYKQSGSPEWVPLEGDTAFRLYAKQTGQYRAVWTYTNTATCTTAVDSVDVDSIKVIVANFLPNQAGFYNQYFATAKIQSGIKPYSLNWTNVQECLTESCDSVLILSPFEFTILTITDSLGCMHSDTARGGLFGKRFVIPEAPTTICDGPNLVCNGGFEESVNLSLPGGGSGGGNIANSKHWAPIDGSNVDYYRTSGVSSYDITNNMIYEVGQQGMETPNLYTGVTNSGFVGFDPVLGVFGQTLGAPLKPGHRYIFKHFWRASSRGQYIPKISPFGISVFGSSDELLGTYKMSFPTYYNDPPATVWAQYYPGSANVIQFPSVEGAKYVIHNTGIPFLPLEPNWLVGNFGNMAFGLKYAYLDDIYLAPFPTISCSELFVPSSGGVQIQFEEDDTWLDQFTTDNSILYSWSPTTGLDDPTIARPTATPTVATTYTCTITLGFSGPSYALGSVTVHPSHIKDLGTNPPRGCCPIAYTTNAACTDDFNNAVTGPDLTFDVVVQKVGSNPFKELYIVTYGEDFGTDLDVQFYYNSIPGFTTSPILTPTNGPNGSYLKVESGDILNNFSNGTNFATFRIRIDATQSNPTGNFEYQIYTLDPGSPGPDCCRRITKSGIGFNAATAPYFPISQETNEVPNWKVFPNPTKGEITLETQWENSIYSITNALGKEVQTGLISQPSQKILVPHLLEGYYQISVIHEGIRSVKSLIIQK